MSLTGQIQNGVVVLDKDARLPEGTRVTVQPVDQDGKPLADLGSQLLTWAGKGVDLPEDLAANHDHYLHGQPKK